VKNDYYSIRSDICNYIT